VSNLILFYNWKAIITDYRTNAEILKTINRLTVDSSSKYRGKSFLLKPKTFLALNTVTSDEKIEALKLASQRNHFNYWFNGFRATYMDFCGVSLAVLKLNRLLRLDAKQRLIYFIHED
jgi:hypothetical protein